MNQLLEALKAIPVILPLLEQLVAFAKKNFGEDWKKVFKDATDAFTQLNEAKTPDDKVKAGKAIQDIFAKLNAVLLVSVLVGCASLHPSQTELKVETCISNPVNKGFECVRPDKSNYFLPFSDSDNFVCYSPSDMHTITKRLIECKESQAFCVPQK